MRARRLDCQGACQSAARSHSSATSMSRRGGPTPTSGGAPYFSAGHRCAAPWRAPRAGRAARRAVHAHAAPGPSHSHCDPPPTSRRSRQRTSVEALRGPQRPSEAIRGNQRHRQRTVEADRVRRLWYSSLRWCIRFMWRRRRPYGRRGGRCSGCRGRRGGRCSGCRGRRGGRLCQCSGQSEHRGHRGHPRGPVCKRHRAR